MKAKSTAKNCKIAGHLHPEAVDNETAFKLKLALGISPDSDLGDLFKAFRVVVGIDCIIYSEKYFRMSKRIEFVVLASIQDLKLAIW